MTYAEAVGRLLGLRRGEFAGMSPGLDRIEALLDALGAGEDAVRAGLARARWPGRLTIVRRDPWLILDGAHNPAGARALAASLRALFGDTPVTFVLGIYADKDARGILDALRPLAAR